MKQKHSNRLCSVIVSIIVILLVLIAVSLFWVNSRLCFVDYTPYSYSESGDAIKNPYVGLYSILRLSSSKVRHIYYIGLYNIILHLQNQVKYHICQKQTFFTVWCQSLSLGGGGFHN